MTKYQERFSEVVRYIESNLDSELDVALLCQFAYLSKYHFHRQCSVFFGMPVMSLVRLLRLKRAAYQLAYRELNIINIALGAGYESHEAFTRAFKKHFSKTPAGFRSNPDWAPWQAKYDPIEKLRSKIVTNKSELAVEIVDFPETLIAVMEHRGAPNKLGSTLKNFIEWRKKNRLPPGKSKTFNLIYDDPNLTAPEDYRFDVGCSVVQPADTTGNSIVNKRIPSGQCALVRHIGSDDTVGAIMNYLYSAWLQDSGFELRDFPIVFERVNFFPEVPENEMITDIYLPIE